MNISSISAYNNTRATSATSDTSTASRVPKQVLGQDDFMKLLATQFQAQDPMKPMEDTAFIAQMAQFSSLEQSSSMAKDMTQLRTNQDIVTANSYIGRHLTVDLGQGKTGSGDVSGVDMSAGVPRLIIGDQTYPLSSVLLVEPGTASNPAPQPVPSGGA